MKYKNIAISGKPATGTSTLAKNLLQTLEPYGWVRINIGDIQREYDRKRGVDERFAGSDTREDSWERDIDAMTLRKLQEEKKLIYEAWLAGFIAKELKNVLKILLICKDDLRIDRLVNRDQITIEQAKRQLQEREKGNIKKWKALYGDCDFWNQKYFDLVIDTYSSGPMETVGKVLDTLNFT